MIRLTKLEMDNFLSHVSTSINLESYKGLVLIEGMTSDGHYSSNGAGKSTILEGIVYALTGDTLRGLSVNDVVNRNYKKNTRVSLSFSKDDEEYTVIRYRKDDTKGDSLFFMKGEKDISKRVNKETQKLLEDTLGISYKILISTVLLGEGLSSRFTQLSDPEKKSLIESTLNMNYDIGKIRESANVKLKSSKLSNATLEGEISVLEGLESENREELESKIQENEKLIKSCDEDVIQLESEYTSVLSDIDSINPKISVIRDTIYRISILNREHEDLIKENNDYLIEMKNVRESSDSVCPVCHQSLSSEESMNHTIESYNNKLKKNQERIDTITKEILGLPNLSILKEKADSLNYQYEELRKKSNKIQEDIRDYKIKRGLSSQEITSMTLTLSTIATRESALEEKNNKKSLLSKDIMKYEYFYELFSPTGVIVNILSDAIDYINSRLSVYSEVLLEKDYHINFVKGKISLVDSKNASYQSLSNGEKRRLDIAIQFSLHDYVHMYCGMKLDCCFIDEILDTLDDTGVENIFDILRLKIEYCQLKSIYVITHNNSLKSKFDQIITVRKNIKGDSYLD